MQSYKDLKAERYENTFIAFYPLSQLKEKKAKQINNKYFRDIAADLEQTLGKREEFNHYRRLRRAYNRNGKEGLLNYIQKLVNRFQLPPEGSAEHQKLTQDIIDQYTQLMEYFKALAIAIEHNGLLYRELVTKEKTKK